MNKNYKILGDAVALFHFACLVAAIIALSLIFIFPGLKIFVIYSTIIFIGSNIFYRGCPCTVFEKYFRRKYDPATVYEDPCIQHYINKFFHAKVSGFTIRACLYTYMAILLVFSLI